jgi:DNA ligase D-like protein (predicted ligase)
LRIGGFIQRCARFNSAFRHPTDAMVKKSSLQNDAAGFVEPMECLPVTQVPDGAEWTYEIKLDGFRLEAVRRAGETTLYSRRRNVLNRKFHYVATALNGLPDGTVLDGELVALGANGHPDFSLLQSFRAAEPRIFFYAFDILFHKNKNVMRLPLSERRELLYSVIKPNEHVRISEAANSSAVQMMQFVKKQGLEGLVAKRADSVYEPGERSGQWVKHRINLGQEFIIGGYIPGHLGVEALIIGFYRGKDLIFSARVRGGLTPVNRREIFEKIKHLATPKCPFVNLPQIGPGRWGPGLTAEKMKECVWLRPQAVAEVQFLEWSSPENLRHAKFVALRDDKDPRKVVRET